jgi:hypothetical protein
MAYVGNEEELDEWRIYVACNYIADPPVAALLQLVASKLDRTTWEMVTPRAVLADQLGVSRSTFYRNWDAAMKTRLLDKVRHVEYEAGNRTIASPVLRLVLPGRK